MKKRAIQKSGFVFFTDKDGALAKSLNSTKILINRWNKTPGTKFYDRKTLKRNKSLPSDTGRMFVGEETRIGGLALALHLFS